MPKQTRNSRVDTRVVANVYRLADGQTNGWKTGSLYHTMPKAGVTKMSWQAQQK